MLDTNTGANQGWLNGLTPNLPRYMRIYGPAKLADVGSRAWPVTTAIGRCHNP